MNEKRQSKRMLLGTAVALTATQGLVPAAFGQDSRPVTREEYNKLQQEHEQLVREVRELRGQAPATTGTNGTAAASADAAKSGDALSLNHYIFPGSSRFHITGYGMAEFQARRREDATFNAQLNPLMLWRISDRILFEGEIEMELEDGETSTKLEQAHLAYVANDWVTFDAGKFLNPMNSFVERFHMAWVNRLPDKPLAVYDGLLPETYVGAQVRGGVPLGATRLNYSAFVGNAPKLVSSVGPDDDAETLGTLEWDNFGNEGGRVAFGGHVGFQPIPALEIGYGLHYSGVGSGENVLLQSIDLNYVQDSDALGGLVRVNGQWVWSHLGRGIYDDNGYPVAFRNNRDGGYAQIAYRPTHFGPNFLRHVEGVARFDRFHQEKTPVGYNENRYTFGLNYWLTSRTVCKLAYQIDDKNNGGTDNNGVLVQFATGF